MRHRARRDNSASEIYGVTPIVAGVLNRVPVTPRGVRLRKATAHVRKYSGVFPTLRWACQHFVSRPGELRAQKIGSPPPYGRIVFVHCKKPGNTGNRYSPLRRRYLNHDYGDVSNSSPGFESLEFGVGVRSRVWGRPGVRSRCRSRGLRGLQQRELTSLWREEYIAQRVEFFCWLEGYLGSHCPAM